MQPLGDRAIRLARPPVPARALVRAIRAWPGVVDVVVARDDVAVYFAGEPAIDPDRLAALAQLDDVAEPTRDLELRAIYDGEDLAHVAEVAGLTPRAVIELHASATHVVDMLGFLPGFAYMTGLDPRLALPRRDSPRARVPAGSLAIAGGYTGVYPFASPGGWHLIGRVDAVMFDTRGPLLALGDRVRFRPC